MKLLHFFLGKLVEDLAAHAGVINQAQGGEANVLHAVFAVHHGRNSKCSTCAVINALADVANAHGNGVEGSALVFDDQTAGLLDELFNFLVVLIPVDAILVGGAVLLAVYVVIGDMYQRPGNEAAVAMLAVNVGMDVLGTDVEALCQLRLQTAGVQNGAGADDLMLRQTGNLGKYIGENIHGVGYDDINCGGGVLDGVLSHILDDVDVGLRQIQTGHAGLSGHATGDDDDVRTHDGRIIATTDDGGGVEGSALIDIQCFAEGFLLVYIHQNDLRGNTLDHKVVCYGSANITSANNTDLTHMITFFLPVS